MGYTLSSNSTLRDPHGSLLTALLRVSSIFSVDLIQETSAMARSVTSEFLWALWDLEVFWLLQFEDSAFPLSSMGSHRGAHIASHWRKCSFEISSLSFPCNLSWSEAWPHDLIAPWTWTSFLDFLDLGLLLCKVKMRVPILSGCSEDKVISNT